MPSTGPHRPRYHFLPAANWMNDPNGLIHWQGRYHLFYQYNPNGPFHGTIHWGHAVSADLVHWEELPIALTPSAGPDAGGCWSGCIVIHNNVPHLLYTAVQPQTQCLAVGSPNLLTWQKYSGNPVITAPPVEVVGGSRWEWRDPWVWNEGDTWYMLVGSGIEGHGGLVFLYQSSDLVKWDYVHPILDSSRLDLGDVWECPSLFPLGDRHVLLLSPVPESRHTYYLSGAYVDQKFNPGLLGKTDYGPYFYAAQTLREEGSGRRLMWGWLKEGRNESAQRAAGWTGVMSLPRVLSLEPDGTLNQRPAPELAQLRERHFQWENLALESIMVLPDCAGLCLEILAEFEIGNAQQLGLWVLSAPDQSEGVFIAYDTVAQQLIVKRHYAKVDPALDSEALSVPLVLTGQSLSLHIFIDCSVVEVFAPNQLCLTTRFYPSQVTSTHVALAASGGQAYVTSLDVWTMRAIR